jgi:hypothetical protein
VGRRKASPGSARQNIRISFAEVAPAESTSLLGSNSTLYPLNFAMNSTNLCTGKLKISSFISLHFILFLSKEGVRYILLQRFIHSWDQESHDSLGREPVLWIQIFPFAPTPAHPNCFQAMTREDRTKAARETDL